jgi:hypothetical protein
MSERHDIYLRSHTVADQKKDPKGSHQQRDPKWPEHALVFDCETRITADQTLTFGFWRFCQLREGAYEALEEGIFHDDHQLSARELKFLCDYAKREEPDTAEDGCDTLRVYSRSKFLHEALGMAIQAKALIVGFNLPFDLSRLAVDWNPAKDGGWTLIPRQWRNPKTGAMEPDESFPRVVVKALNSKTALISSTRAPMFVAKKKNKGKNKKRERVPHWPAGRFLDVRTLIWALRNKSCSLK